MLYWLRGEKLLAVVHFFLRILQKLSNILHPSRQNWTTEVCRVRVAACSLMATSKVTKIYYFQTFLYFMAEVLSQIKSLKFYNYWLSQKLFLVEKKILSSKPIFWDTLYNYKSIRAKHTFKNSKLTTKFVLRNIRSEKHKQINNLLNIGHKT